MSTASDVSMPPPPTTFSGLVGAKRRRMRSGGNVSTLPKNSNNSYNYNNDDDNDDDGGGDEMGVIDPSSMDPDEKVAQTSKCKGATTIPIFLKSKSVVFGGSTISMHAHAQETDDIFIASIGADVLKCNVTISR
jgi:hypothetical protein